MAAHAKNFSGSGAWDLCSQWVSDPTGSAAALTGTIRHALAEMNVRALLADRAAPFPRPTTVTLDDDSVHAVSQEDLDAARLATEWLRENGILQEAREVFVEEKVRFGPVLGIADPEEGFGRLDVGIRGERVLRILDFKFGYALVSPEVAQLRRYAVGLYFELTQRGLAEGIEVVELIVVQPEHPEKMVRKAEYPLSALADWVMEARAHVANRFTTYTPGETQCRYCLKRGSCEARLAQATERLVDGSVPDPMAPADLVTDLADEAKRETPGELDDARLSGLLDAAPLIISYLRDVQEEGVRRLQAGKTDLRWKLVAGKRSRKWVKSDEETREFFYTNWKLPKRDGTNRKGEPVSGYLKETLKSPAEMEKVIHATCGPRRQKAFAELWRWTEGKPVLAPLDDPRPAVDRSSFEDLTENPPEWL